MQELPEGTKEPDVCCPGTWGKLHPRKKIWSVAGQKCWPCERFSRMACDTCEAASWQLLLSCEPCAAVLRTEAAGLLSGQSIVGFLCCDWTDTVKHVAAHDCLNCISVAATAGIVSQAEICSVWDLWWTKLGCPILPDPVLVFSSTHFVLFKDFLILMISFVVRAT